MAAEATPLMKQYETLKAQVEDALLFFRMGDFYELFGPDAILASQILEITLTTRDRNKVDAMPMAGVPFHSALGYIQRLLKAGKKVAIAEQVEEATPNKLVRREVVRILTPAIQFETDSEETRFLGILWKMKNGAFQFVALDPSTGEARFSTPHTLELLRGDFDQKTVKHLLYSELDAKEVEAVITEPSILRERSPAKLPHPDRAYSLLKDQFGYAVLDPVFEDEGLLLLFSMLVETVLRTQQQTRLLNLKVPTPFTTPKTLGYGLRTREHLDLFPDTISSTQGRRPTTLFEIFPKPGSSAGLRKLKSILENPLRAVPEIHYRQSKVQALSKSFSFIQALDPLWKEAYDLERILGRVSSGLASPRDTLALGRTLSLLPQFLAKLEAWDSEYFRGEATSLRQLSPRLSPLWEEILKIQKDPAPFHGRDGGLFLMGANADLDRLIDLTEKGERWLIELEQKERAATGINNLKVKYNRVFGYYIEITSAHLKSVPEHYQRKQTMVGAERFYTEELKEFEQDILTAASKRIKMEQHLFAALITKVATFHEGILAYSRIIAELDALCALAKLSFETGYIFPEITDEVDTLSLVESRHPVVERNMDGNFIANSVHLGGERERLLIITGPNMGGKSTVMRQIALIVILGQCGAPVPARAARWGAFSSIHTRIGAHDAIARGQSTFMVEMVELAHLLRHADERSLILLDEIGRGTSTYDGISVAGSTLEYLDGHVKARTLFATHYHELTALPNKYPRTMANAHMGVEGDRTEFRFQYLLKNGPSNDSFGIQVAELAGLPLEVISRAWDLLEELEGQGSHVVASPAPEPAVTDKFGLDHVGDESLIPEKIKRLDAGSRIKPPSKLKSESENQLALF